MVKSPTLVINTDYEILQRYVVKLDSTIYPKRRPHHPRVVRSYKDDITKADAEIKANSEFSTSPYTKPRPNPSTSSWWNIFSWISDSNPSTPQSQVKVPLPRGSSTGHTPQTLHHAPGLKSLDVEGLQQEQNTDSGSTVKVKGSKSAGSKGGKYGKTLAQPNQHTSGLH